ncbi:MAG TPA: hypothetical protein DEH24_01785 [Alteromonas sp.]|nr:hypothetical protein [Alteromonadaceae bacterium]MAX43849.1 hypothetical protein [Alteromonadaceae bacterium]HBY38114.1 hypothetical protein [Alteromonas sp.]
MDKPPKRLEQHNSLLVPTGKFSGNNLCIVSYLDLIFTTNMWIAGNKFGKSDYKTINPSLHAALFTDSFNSAMPNFCVNPSLQWGLRIGLNGGYW